MDNLRQAFLIVAGSFIIIYMLGACLLLWLDLIPRLAEVWKARKARRAYRDAETPPRH